MLPKIAFTPATIESDADMLSYFLETDWARFVIARYPDLKDASVIRDADARYQRVFDYLSSRAALDLPLLEQACDRFEAACMPIWNGLTASLAAIIGVDFPADKEHIMGFVSRNPINPRNLNGWTFNIGLMYDKPESIRRIVAHETAHFLHFRLLRQMHPDVNPDTFEAPHPNWLASELAVVPLLNDQRIQPYIGEAEMFYEEHRTMSINGKPLPLHVEESYQGHVINQGSYASFVEALTDDIERM